MNWIKNLIILVAAAAGLCSCGYDSQPPRTDDSAANYVLPKGEIPSEAEILEVQALKEAYSAEIGELD